MKHKNHILYIVIVTGVILLVPFIAMFFTDEVKWDATDFIAMGALVFGTGLLYELLSRRVNSPLHRAGIGLGLLAISFVTWVELATGGVSRTLGL